MKSGEIVVVCGYGCFLTGKYAKYLGRVAEYVRGNTVEKVIVCGGPTQQQSAPGCSEAQVMRIFLEQRISAPIVEEDESYTTFANLRNARAQLPFPTPAVTIVIFCDAIRALKVRLLAEKEFHGYAVRIETFDIGAGSAKKQLISTCGETLLLFFPFIMKAKEWCVRVRAKTR